MPCKYQFNVLCVPSKMRGISGKIADQLFTSSAASMLHDLLVSAARSAARSGVCVCGGGVGVGGWGGVSTYFHS